VVKNAAQDFLSDALAAVPAGSTRPPRVGMVWYNNDPNVISPGVDADLPCSLESVDDDCAAVGTTAHPVRVCLLDETEFTPPWSLPEFGCKLPLRRMAPGLTSESSDDIGLQNMRIEWLKMRDRDGNQTPEPKGATGTGLALDAAVDHFDWFEEGTDDKATRIVLLLTDGQHNRPAGFHPADPTLSL